MKINTTNSDREKVACGFCGSSNVTTRLEEEQFIYGEGDGAVRLAATIPVHKCGSCDAEFTDYAAEDIRHEAVCRHLGLLTPADIQNLRVRHGLSRSEFAKLTRLGEATVARWERGSLIQNAAYDQLLRLLQYDDNLERLRRASADESAAPVPIGQFRFLTVDQARLNEQAEFRLRRTA